MSTEKAQPSSLTTGFTTALTTPKISATGDERDDPGTGVRGLERDSRHEHRATHARHRPTPVNAAGWCPTVKPAQPDPS
jgi:hypothetical protein